MLVAAMRSRCVAQDSEERMVPSYCAIQSQSRRYPGTVAKNAVSSDNLDFREREDHLAALRDKLLLAGHNPVLEMPGKHDEVVRIHGARFLLGDDRDAGAGRER